MNIIISFLVLFCDMFAIKKIIYLLSTKRRQVKHYNYSYTRTHTHAHLHTHTHMHIYTHTITLTHTYTPKHTNIFYACKINFCVSTIYMNFVVFFFDVFTLKRIQKNKHSFILNAMVRQLLYLR